MKVMKKLLVLMPLALLLADARGAPDQRRPYVAYVCAAGAQRGTTVTVRAAGQNLRGVNEVYVSGKGVTAKVVKFLGNITLLRPEQRRNLQRQLREQQFRLQGRKMKKPAKEPELTEKEKKRAVLPDHPLLKNLDKLGAKELRKVARYFFDPTQRQQFSPQIAETVELEVTVAPDAEPGDRELRLGTPRGMTNPVPFRVGVYPETAEMEINDFDAMRLPAIDTALVVNGQVSVRDVDRFRFRARGGQRLVIRAEARRLVPYLADAVPGWFQAVLGLADAEGNEVAFSDDYRFDPDPVLLFEVPQDGEYELTVRDAIHRGREDFVYRITIGEQPFVTWMFPLGGREGERTVAAVAGWNLPAEEVELDTRPGAGRFREVRWPAAESLSGRLPYAVDDLPECWESEPNDNAGRAQRLDLPKVVNGRIAAAGDVDVFAFAGKAGDEIVAEVTGRRLASPIDSLLTVTDASGKLVAQNDDRPDPSAGLVTHQADSYLVAKLPADGTYLVRLTDTQGHGGPDYAYRLRVGPPRPDFTVILTPSSLNVPAASRALVTVHAVRRDGFDGPIDLEVEGGGGFALQGARIPAGVKKIRMTLQVPDAKKRLRQPVRLVASAVIGEKTVRRPVIPAEDMMQAFGLRHLVAAEELIVSIARTRGRRIPLRIQNRGPVRIPVGGSAAVRINAPGLPVVTNLRLVLSEPPPGVSLGEVGFEKDRVTLFLRADRGEESVKAGEAGNLIVEVYAEYDEKRDGKPTGRKRRNYLGVLPAIPFVVFER